MCTRFFTLTGATQLPLAAMRLNRRKLRKLLPYFRPLNSAAGPIVPAFPITCSGAM